MLVMVVGGGGEYAMGAALHGKLLIDSFSSSRSSCREHKPNLDLILKHQIKNHEHITRCQFHLSIVFVRHMYEVSN